MTTLKLSKVQRDCLRFHISSAASTAGNRALRETREVPEDRESVFGALDQARQLLGLLDRIGWEINTPADECVVQLADHEVDLFLTLREGIEGAFEDDHRDDDRAVLEAMQSMKAVTA